MRKNRLAKLKMLSVSPLASCLVEIKRSDLKKMNEAFRIHPTNISISASVDDDGV